ncbi:hypothetical protein PJL15_03569 [Paenarthrobacter nitroguajacolicus]|nr:hypothetical protein [Paenarthrobacter nitroguajacolicus]
MCHYEKLGLHQELSLYIFSRIVPVAHKSTNAPQLQHGIHVFGDEAPKNYCSRYGSSDWSGGQKVERRSRGRESATKNTGLGAALSPIEA